MMPASRPTPPIRATIRPRTPARASDNPYKTTKTAPNGGFFSSLLANNYQNLERGYSSWTRANLMIWPSVPKKLFSVLR